MDHARDLLDFWFGRLPMSPAVLADRMAFWFGSDVSREEQAARDADIATRFGPLLARAAAGELDAWTSSPRRLLALILLCDQVPRNAYRGTARAFLYDARALACALGGMAVAADAALDPVERMFFYMPLQHAESRDVQDESVAAFERLLTEVPASIHEVFAGSLTYAREHRDIVRRFGRFPHRNAALGRDSTPEEAAYLAAGAVTFGQ